MNKDKDGQKFMLEINVPLVIWAIIEIWNVNVW